jgi:hypothetical protein
VGYGRNPSGQQEAWLADISLNGDFDNNFIYDCADIDALVATISVGTHDPTFDMTGDGLVNHADLDLWLATAGKANLGPGRTYLPGDADLSGSVDGSDFGVWNANKFTATAAWCRGDFSADGTVDGSDFGIWNTRKFTSSDTANVPEPVSFFGLAFVLFNVMRGRSLARTPIPKKSTIGALISPPGHMSWQDGLVCADSV